MANARDERHRYGQHYTPHEVAILLAAFAVRSSSDLVLDPSCGDGRLLEQALIFEKQFSRGNRLRNSGFPSQVFGVERSAVAVQAARRTGASVAIADFFDVEPGTRLNLSAPVAGKDACPPESLPLEFDVIIGNPPYIRQEVIGVKEKRRVEDRLVRDQAASPDVFWPRWSGRSDIYVYFFARSIRFLKQHGRLVFLTASSWLDAGYGAALREFLLRNFRVIALVESDVESFFADASINTCITVLERDADAGCRKANPIRFVQLREPLANILNATCTTAASTRLSAIKLAALVEDTLVSETFATHRIRVVRQADISAPNGGLPGKNRTPTAVASWGKYLRAEDVFFRILERGGSRLLSLSKMANVRFGVKTGANEFFYVKDGQEALGEAQEKTRKEPRLLALADVASVRRGITTGANEFFYLSNAHVDLESESSRARESTNGVAVVRDATGKLREIEADLLTPVVFSLKEIPGILLERVKAKRMLFNCRLTPSDLAGTHALEYIKSGERAGYHRRPTCSNREPWYSVARGMRPAPLIFPSKVGERWLVALNRARVFEDKKLYGVFPTHGVSALLLAALLNSTWARYYAEVTCRQMTGAQAIADIDVAVAGQLLLPDPRKLSSAIKKRLEAAVIELSRRPVYSVFEEIKRADRRSLDSLTLEVIGFSNRSEREPVLDQLYEAVTALVQARLSKSRRL